MAIDADHAILLSAGKNTCKYTSKQSGAIIFSMDSFILVYNLVFGSITEFTVVGHESSNIRRW